MIAQCDLCPSYHNRESIVIKTVLGLCKPPHGLSSLLRHSNCSRLSSALVVASSNLARPLLISGSAHDSSSFLKPLSLTFMIPESFISSCSSSLH